MKKSLALSALALATALTLTGTLSGCTKSASSNGSDEPSSVAVPSTSITSAAQVTDLDAAAAYALKLTPDTPDAVDQIDQTGKLLKQYTDASSKLTADEKSQIDAFVDKSQQAVGQKDVANAGGSLATAARAVLQALAAK